MSKITRTEYLDNIRNIITEGMSDAPDYNGSDRFNISRYIAGLLEEGHRDPKLMDYLMNWNNALKTLEPNTEYRSYRQFAEGLVPYSKGNIAIKKVIGEINECLKHHGAELEVYCAIDRLSDIDAQHAVREAYNEYLYEPTEDHRKSLTDALYPSIVMNEAAALRIMTVLTDESVVSKEINGDYLLEQSSYYEDIARQMAKRREEKKTKRIQEKLEAYAEELFENARKQKESFNLAALANNNNIGLSRAIKSIASSDAKKNKKLMETLDQYAGALNTGLYEERLYETFLHNMSAYTYLLPVENAVKTINENVKKNQVSIEITKLLEEMSESSSWELLPLIEEDCVRYAKQPSPTNRVQLRNCLIQFAHDPYCYKILEMVDRDNSKEANTLSEQAINFKDNVKLIREHAKTSGIYSPVQYIKEGECVFNANGTYFIKKNNTISKLTPDVINQLSEKFVTLCKLTNDPCVTINEDCIILANNDKVAKIHEGYVDINGVRETQSTLRNLQEMCMKYDFDTNFFIMASCLLENFNNIAKINFGTHIELRENAGINVDMFRLGDNIFINTVNEDTQSATFYHNVNPLQCKNIINGHMGINVSTLFENLLPAQDKLIMILNETQEAYTESINKLESTIEKLEASKSKCSDEAIKKIDDGIKIAQEKLKEVKDAYKKWQKEVEDKTGEDMGAEDEPETEEPEVNGDGEVRKETTEEPLEDDEVEDNIDELSTPITDDTKAGEAFNLTDAEFDSYLNTDDEASDDILPDADVDDVNTEDTVDDILSDEIKADSDVDFDFDDSAEDATEDEDVPADDAEQPVDDADVAVEDEVDDVIADGRQDEEFPIDTIDDDFISSGDEGFDELSDEDNINIETPAEELPSDEDIIMGDTEDEVDATDILGGDVTDPLDDNKVVSDDILPKIDVNTVNTEVETQFITKVLFDENIKTGEKYRSGTISVITPMISGEGKLYNKSDDYKFYLNDENEPIIDAGDMTVTLYNAIVSKIKSDVNYDVFVKEGTDRINTEDANVEDDAVTKVNVAADNDEGILPDDEAVKLFTVTDLPDEFSIEADFDDDFESEDKDGEESAATILPVETEEHKSVETPFIPTYKSGETEIELPAPSVDGSEIPESKKVDTKKKSVNEKRAAIKSVGASLKTKKGTHFFVNEDTDKSSIKMNRRCSALASEKFVGAVNGVKGSLIENYDPELETSPINQLHYYAVSLAHKVAALTGDVIYVTDVMSYLVDDIEINGIYSPYYFNIKMNNSNNPELDSYTVYLADDDIYYRPTVEFEDILADLEDEVPGQTIEALKVQYMTNDTLPAIPTDNNADMEYTIRAIIQSLIGTIIHDNELNERCKIRKAKLSSGHNFENSKLADDILHGDKEERDFKAQVEKDTKAAGVENPLAPSAPAAEEAYVPVLPNVHRKMSISEMMENYNIIYEANDHVIYNKIKAEVMDVSEDGLTANILLSDGATIKVATKDLEPDPEYINDLNAQDDMPNAIKNEQPDSSKDLDAKTLSCNIVVDGKRINIEECYAYLNDIIDSKKQVRVINETGAIDEFDIDTNLEFNEWPYAVVINASGEPVRKILVNPNSYVNAEPDDLVQCLCGGKDTNFPKRSINILS